MRLTLSPKIYGFLPVRGKSARQVIGRASRSVIEPLEGRLCLSVSLSSIANPYNVAGTQHLYESLVNGVAVSNFTETATGNTTTFNGNTASEVDVTQTTATTGTAVNLKTYFAQTDAGLVSYGSVAVGTSAGVATTITTTLSPYSLVFPTSATAGVTTTTSYTSTDVIAPSTGATPTTTTTQYVETFELTSEALQPVTVLAGTFNAYVVDTTETTTDSSGSTSTSSSQEWLAPGKGLVKQTDTSDGSTEDEELSSFTAGTAGGGGVAAGTGITPSVVTDTVPTAVVGGAKLHSAIKLDLTDSEATNEAGYTVNVYASTDNTLDTSTDALVTTLAKPRSTIKSAHTAVVSIPITKLPAALPNGTYYLIAQTVDGAGNSQTVSPGTTVTVAAPFVLLSETVTNVLPAALVSGTKVKGTVKLQLINTGNIPSTGVTAINLTASTVPGVIGTSFATLNKKITIPVGRTITVSVPVKSIPVLPDGSYYTVAEVTDPKTGISVASSTPTTIAAPFISLTVVLGSIVKVKSGDTVVITNNGNVADLTRIHGTFGFALDAAGTQPVGTTATLSSGLLNIKPGKSVKYHVSPSKALLASLLPGVPYYLTLSYTDDSGHSGTTVSPDSFTL